MRLGLAPLLLVCLCFGFAPTQPNTGTLVVNVHWIDPDLKGTLLISLFNQPDGFPDQPALSKAYRIVPVKGEVSTVEFEDLPFGQYAVAVLHDEDGDEEIDTNWFGIPTEGWCVSNNVRHTFSAPEFGESSITLDDPILPITLDMGY